MKALVFSNLFINALNAHFHVIHMYCILCTHEICMTAACGGIRFYSLTQYEYMYKRMHEHKDEYMYVACIHV